MRDDPRVTVDLGRDPDRLRDHARRAAAVADLLARRRGPGPAGGGRAAAEAEDLAAGLLRAGQALADLGDRLRAAADDAERADTSLARALRRTAAGP